MGMDYKDLHDKITDSVRLDEQETLKEEAKARVAKRHKLKENENKPGNEQKTEAEQEAEAKEKLEQKNEASAITSEGLDVQLEAYLVKKDAFTEANEKVTAFIEAIKAKLDEANSATLKEEVEAMWSDYKTFVKQVEEASQATETSEELAATAWKEFEGKLSGDADKTEVIDDKLKEANETEMEKITAALESAGYSQVAQDYLQGIINTHYEAPEGAYFIIRFGDKETVLGEGKIPKDVVNKSDAAEKELREEEDKKKEAAKKKKEKEDEEAKKKEKEDAAKKKEKEKK